MLAEVVNFDSNGFNMEEDLDVEHEDKRLRLELKQLIAEELNDFDIEDEHDEDGDSSNSNQNCPNEDDVISILEAGKLSLLEGAIQKFGEDVTHPLENTSESNPLSSPAYDEFNKNNGNQLIPRHSSCSLSSPKINDGVNLQINEQNVSTECLNINFSDSEPQVGIYASTSSDIQINHASQVQNKAKADQNIDCERHHSELDDSVGSLHCIERSPLVSNQDQIVRYSNMKLPLVSCSNAFIHTPHHSQNQLLLSGFPDKTTRSRASRIPTFSTDVSSNPSKHTSPCFTQSDSHFVYAQTCRSSPEKSVQFVSTTGDQMSCGSHTISTTSTCNCGESNLSTGMNHDRRELLYEARGRQLQDLQSEIAKLREEVAKEKRLSNHRATLAEGEKEVLRSKLSTVEEVVRSLRKEVVEKQDSADSLQFKLSEMGEIRNKLNDELSALRSTNESLSNQLVELTTGNALKRAEEREVQLAQALEIRYSSQTEQVKSELKSVQHQLLEKETELSELRKQLEISKSDAIKSQNEHAEQLKQANKQLEDAQKHCQQLASSALCSEVTHLRQKILEIETSRKITEDINKILQDELRDCREQISTYENVLKLDIYSHDNDVSLTEEGPPSDNSLIPTKLNPSMKTVTFKTKADSGTEISKVCVPSSNDLPSSAFEQTLISLSNWNLDIKGECCTTNKPEQSKNALDYKKYINNENFLAELDHDLDLFHSLSNQDILTSTPAVSATGAGTKKGIKSSMNKLKYELERCLYNYKIKREQITKLHENLFTTRCHLHKIQEEKEKAEKSGKILEERVQSLERELFSIRNVGDSPGPRELILSGQLERLKGDYKQLEEELQTNRTRLQSALRAEAKALEAEKTATERLSASIAERDAAVDRATAVCESRCAAIQRQLELDFANEREANAKRAEEKLLEARNEISKLNHQVQSITQLYKEAQLSAQQTVEIALNESMKEREAERIRFWREELPKQLEFARQTWEQENEVVREVPLRKTIDQVNHHVQTNLSDFSTNVEVQTISHEILNMSTQTDPYELISLKFEREQMESQTVKPLLAIYPVLSKFLSTISFKYLCTHLIETSELNLTHLEEEIALNSKLLFYKLLCESWQFIDTQMAKICTDHRLNNLVQFGTTISSSSLKSIDFISSSFNDSTYCCLTGSMTDKLSNLISLQNSSVHQQESILNKLKQLINLCKIDNHCSKSDEDIMSQTNSVLNKCVQTSFEDQKYYFETLDKIRTDVLEYVKTCQNRAAQALHSELARVHQRACRQFTSQLRKALVGTNGSSLSSTLTFDARNPVMSNHQNNLSSDLKHNVKTSQSSCFVHNPRSQSAGRQFHHTSLNSEDVTQKRCNVPRLPHNRDLLNLIDEVCTITETKFHADTESKLFIPNIDEILNPEQIIMKKNSDFSSQLLTNVCSTNLVSSKLDLPIESVQFTSQSSHYNENDFNLIHNNSDWNRLNSLSTPIKQITDSKHIDQVNLPQISCDADITVKNRKTFGTKDLFSSANSSELIHTSLNVKPVPIPRVFRPNRCSYTSPKSCDKEKSMIIKSLSDSLNNSNEKTIHMELFKLFELCQLKNGLSTDLSVNQPVD